MGTLDEPTGSESIIADPDLGKVRTADLDEGDTFPHIIWQAQTGERLQINDIVVSVWEHSGGRSIFDIELRKGGGWVTLMRVGTIVNGIFNFSHAFKGRIVSDKYTGVGTDNLVRIRTPAGHNSTAFDLMVVVTGRKV